MKKLTLIIWLALETSSLTAQSRQIKLYLQQIAANKVLIEYLRKGYSIARFGLTTIGDIKNGDWNLHRNFFGALDEVNPKIKKYAGTLNIMILAVNVEQLKTSTIKKLHSTGFFSNEELQQVRGVFRRVTAETNTLLDEFTKVLSSDNFQMSDDERISRISSLNNELTEVYAFANEYANNALILSAQRAEEQQSVDISRKLNGIAR